MLFRKQLSSLKQRLQVANTSYYGALLRSSTGGSSSGVTGYGRMNTNSGSEQSGLDGNVSDAGLNNYINQNMTSSLPSYINPADVTGGRNNTQYMPRRSSNPSSMPSIDELMAQYEERRQQLVGENTQADGVIPVINTSASVPLQGTTAVQ